MDHQFPRDKKTLRNFGLLIGFMIPIMFGLVIPWIWSKPYPMVPHYIGAPFILLALIAPGMLLYIYIPWMKFGMVMGWLNTRLILGLIFFLLFTPLALFFKLIGRDGLKRKFDKKVESYRINSKDEGEFDRVKRMKFPF